MEAADSEREQRLHQRQVRGGATPEAAREWVVRSDRPNGELVKRFRDNCTRVVPGGLVPRHCPRRAPTKTDHRARKPCLGTDNGASGRPGRPRTRRGMVGGPRRGSWPTRPPDRWCGATRCEPPRHHSQHGKWSRPHSAHESTTPTVHTVTVVTELPGWNSSSSVTPIGKMCLATLRAGPQHCSCHEPAHQGNTGRSPSTGVSRPGSDIRHREPEKAESRKNEPLRKRDLRTR